MKEYLNQNGVEFDAKDVVENPENLQEMLEKTGGLRGVPVILVGNDVIRGFNRDLLKARLGLPS
ncbi:MAG TPA: glutaredoxin family protein [Symbiobacteriaceae bacterium]|nr:glutaredoxin family protein [Symbiobacteriaceae bacterium]